MYAHQQMGADAYYGPVPQGQTWETYQTTQESLAKNLMISGALVATATLLNPAIALVAGLGWLAASGKKKNPAKAGGY